MAVQVAFIFFSKKILNKVFITYECGYEFDEVKDNKMKLVTDNVKDFENIMDIQIENWFKR